MEQYTLSEAILIMKVGDRFDCENGQMRLDDDHHLRWSHSNINVFVNLENINSVGVIIPAKKEPVSAEEWFDSVIFPGNEDGKPCYHWEDIKFTYKAGEQNIFDLIEPLLDALDTQKVIPWEKAFKEIERVLAYRNK